MPEALVYVVKREINFHIPFGEQAITYSPKSFVGSRHVIRARLALPEEIAARRGLALDEVAPDALLRARAAGIAEARKAREEAAAAKAAEEKDGE